jgi:hypothetical protein
MSATVAPIFHNFPFRESRLRYDVRDGSRAARRQ